MKLSKLECETIVAKLKEYNTKCPVCQENDFKLSEHIFYNKEMMPQEQKGLYQCIPFFVSMCNKCGYIVNFSANFYGLSI